MCFHPRCKHLDLAGTAGRPYNFVHSGVLSLAQYYDAKTHSTNDGNAQDPGPRRFHTVDANRPSLGLSTSSPLPISASHLEQIA